MTDEGFYLTPLDVRRFDFGTALRGYDKTRVDQFRDQVADEMERLTRLNQDLEAKAKGFHEQLRAFRERDKALNEALVSAQQLRADIREQADREAQLILREARSEAERTVDAARDEIRRLSSEVESLERTRRSFLLQLRSLVERQLHDIDVAMEALRLASPAVGTPAVAGPAEGGSRDSAREGGREGNSRTSHPTPAWLDTLVKE